jgi:Caspase domain
VTTTRRRGWTLVGLVALLLLAPAAGAQKPRLERPTYAVGDVWVLSDGTYRMTRLAKDAYVFTAADDREIWLTRDLGITFVRRGAERVEMQTVPRLTWPLEVGKTGAGRSIVRVETIDIEVYTTWRVEAAERVTVAGGTFDALRVRYKFDPEIPGQFGALSVYQRFGSNARLALFDVAFWYAPSIQRIVKSVSSKPLLTFELGGEPPVTAQAPPASPPPARTEPPAPRAEPTPPRVEPRPAPPKPEVAKPEPTPSRPPVAPLVINVSSPSDQTHVDRDTIPLAGLVTSGRGVARVAVTLNGVEVTSLAERSARPAVSLNASLKLREGANLLVIAATDADGAIRQEVRTVHYDRAAPLSIAMQHPVDGARVSEQHTVVAAVVSSSRGVGGVTVTLNGAEVLRRAESKPQPSIVVETPVTLREGANTIVLTARESDGTVRQEVRTVTFTRVAAATPAPPTPVPPVPSRNAYAVVIGVGRYEAPKIPTLKYAVADAEAVYNVLVGTAGFKKENVLLLTDRSERKPTLRNIKYALGTFLARTAQKDDTVIVYFAGHGAPEVDQSGRERDGYAKYLIPSDADPDDLFSSALPMDDLQAIFGRIEAERVVVFLDACYSGAAGGRTFLSQKTRAGSVDDLFLERLTRSKGRAIVTASRTSEVSIELPELGHGIFTYYLAEGLKGAGDLNRDGIVSLQELYEYVEQQVARKSRAVGGNQHPVMKGELEGPLPLTKVRVR